MSIISLATAQAQLNLWLAADAAVASNQEYQIEGRRLRRADAAEIRTNIDYWERKVAQASPATGSRTRYVVSQ